MRYVRTEHRAARWLPLKPSTAVCPPGHATPTRKLVRPIPDACLIQKSGHWGFDFWQWDLISLSLLPMDAFKHFLARACLNHGASASGLVSKEAQAARALTPRVFAALSLSTCCGCRNVAWVPDPENKQDRGVGCFEQSIKSGSKEARPAANIRAPLFAARTLNATGQSRVTLSPR